MNVLWSPAALADLKEIQSHIAADNPARAASFAKEITDAGDAIGVMPRAFHLSLALSIAVFDGEPTATTSFSIGSRGMRFSCCTLRMAHATTSSHFFPKSDPVRLDWALPKWCLKVTIGVREST